MTVNGLAQVDGESSAILPTADPSPTTFMGRDGLPVGLRALLEHSPKPMTLVASRSTEGKSRSLAALRRDIAAMDDLRSSLEDMAEARPMRPAEITQYHMNTLRPGSKCDRIAYLVILLMSVALMISEILGIHRDLASDYRKRLLRLVDSIRAALRLMLIRVLATLSRHRDSCSFTLVMIAIARRFGHRIEPDDYTLPVLTPTSVVSGDAARMC